MKNWLYKDEEITSLDDVPEGKDMEGFVYRITHLPTGKYYIGKKSLWSRRNKKIGKREKARLREERKAKGIGGRLPKKKLVVKESKWQEYHSSNDWIKGKVKEGKEDEFKREIIDFYPDKKALTYYELKHQFSNNVLADKMSLNENLLGKFYKRDLV